MKGTLSDQLKEKLKYDPIDLRAYGQLPQREDILFYAEQLPDEKAQALIKQWEKLNYIRKNIKIVDNYINTNKGETFSQWLTDKNETKNVNPHTLETLGGFNDATKGISVYALNLQKRYDDEEAKYDTMENDKDVAEFDRKDTEKTRTDRGDKRDNRKSVRSIKLKDFKKNDQGYLLVEEEEPTTKKEEVKVEPKKEIKTESKPLEVKKEEVKTNNKNSAAQEVDPNNKLGGEYSPQETKSADGDNATTKTEAKVIAPSADEAMKKYRKVVVLIAGLAIGITAIALISNNSKKQ